MYAAKRRGDGMRILFLTHRLPYAPNRGDRIRAYHLLHTLATEHEVHLVSLVHDDEEAAEVDRLKSVAQSVTAIRVSNRKTSTISSGTRPSHPVGASM